MQRIVQRILVLSSVLQVICGIVLAAFFLILSLEEGNFTWSEGILVALLLCVVLDLVLYATLQHAHPHSGRWQEIPVRDVFDSLAKKFSVYFLIRDTLNLVFGFGAWVAIALFIGYLTALSLEDTELVFTQAAYAQLGTYLVYICLLRPMLITFLSALGKKHENNFMPFYRLEDDGILIDFNVTIIGKDKSPFQVKILFSELEEVKAMSYHEAHQYKYHLVAPNMKLGMQAIKDQALYFTKNIPRPLRYFNTQTAGITLLLRGPEIFYVISVKGEGNDVVHAFEKYQKSRYT